MAEKHPVTPFENVLINSKIARPLAVCIVASPISLEAVIADLKWAKTRLFRFRAAIKRKFGWNWRIEDRATNAEELARHLTVIEDHRIRGISELETLLSKAAMLPFPAEAPPWQVYLINPLQQANERSASLMLHAAVIHFDHSIADGFRMDRMVRMMAGKGRLPPSHEALEVSTFVRRFDMGSFLELPEEDYLVKRPISLFEIDKTNDNKQQRNFKPEGIIDAIATVLDDPKYFCKSKRRCTALEVVSDGTNRTAAEGNFIVFRAIRTQSADPRVKCSQSLAYRLIEPSGPWTFGWGALTPRFVLTKLLQFWYNQFDIFVSFIPGARRTFNVGGAEVKAVYAVSPILADIPTCVTIYSGLDRIFVTLQVGSAIKCTSHELSQIVRKRLTKKIAIENHQRAISHD